MVTVSIGILARKEDTDKVNEIVNQNRKYVDNVVISGSRPIDDFSKVRNELADMCKTDYILFWDTDEKFSEPFMRNLRKMIQTKQSLCYRFPRYNLPDSSGYPDYQVRLYRVMGCKWEGRVHERLVTSNAPQVFADEVECVEVNAFPIIHYPGTLFHRLERFRRQMNLHCVDLASEMLKPILTETDFLLSEIKARYEDQEVRSDLMDKATNSIFLDSKKEGKV